MDRGRGVLFWVKAADDAGGEGGGGRGGGAIVVCIIFSMSLLWLCGEKSISPCNRGNCCHSEDMATTADAALLSHRRKAMCSYVSIAFFPFPLYLCMSSCPSLAVSLSLSFGLFIVVYGGAFSFVCLALCV